MKRGLFMIAFLAALARGAAACGDMRWDAASFSLCGTSSQIADLSPGYAILDACAWDDTAILVLGYPEEPRGDIVRAFRVKDGAVQTAWTAWMQRQRPWRVRAADTDGDGAPELAVGVFNKARFHPVYAERVFLYNLHADGLSPRWLGTRLSRPMVTFALADAAPALPGAELVAVERNADGSNRLAVYNWKGFGYILHSVPLASFSFESIRVADHAILINGKPIPLPLEAP